MGWLTGIAGKVAVGVMSLALVLIGLSWWQADPAARAAAIDGVVKAVSWAVYVLLFPWLIFTVIAWVARMKSNRAAVALVATMTAVETGVLFWLFVFDFHSVGLAFWALLIAAVLIAAVYNVFTCDWIAEKVES